MSAELSPGDDVDRWARSLLARLATGLGEPVAVTVEAEQATALVAAATSGRVVPAFAAAVARGDVVVPDQQAVAITDRWREVMEHCLHVDAMLLDLADQLDDAGIEFRVLKGTAAAHLDHPDPALRQFGDLDLLVRSADLDRVVALLVERGLPRRFPEPRPGFAARFWKSVSLRGAIEVDVHRTLADGPVGPRLVLDDLWVEPELFRLAGRDLPALPAPQRLLHACLHAHLAPPPARLSSLADVGRGVSAADPDRVLELARRWHVLPALAGAADEVMQLTGASAADSAWWATQPSSVLGARVDRAFVGSHRRRSSWVSRSVVTIAVLPGLRNRLDYVTGLARPQRGYSDDDRRGGGGTLRRVVSRRRGGRA